MGFGGHQILDKGFVANEALTKFRVVKIGAGVRNVDAIDADGQQGIGVVQETASAADATAGRVVDVRLLGVSLCEADAAVTAGAPVRAMDTGTVAALAATTADQPIVGIALEAAADAGDWIAVLLTPGVENTTT